MNDSSEGQTHEYDLPSLGLGRRTTTNPETGRVVRDLVMTPAASELLSGLARESGTTEGDVLRMALGMFKVAVDSTKEGKHVGVTAEPEALDIEFVGFLKGTLHARTAE